MKHTELFNVLMSFPLKQEDRVPIAFMHPSVKRIYTVWIVPYPLDFSGGFIL